METGRISVKAMGSILLLALLAAIPITMLSLGIVHIEECGMEPWIPRFLIVGGIIGINLACTSVLIMYLQYHVHVPAIRCIELFRIAIVFLMILWNVFGSVWTFQHWSSWKYLANHPDDGCHNNMYLFTFAYLIIFWITCPCHVGAAFSRYKIQRNMRYSREEEEEGEHGDLRMCIGDDEDEMTGESGPSETVQLNPDG